MTLDDAERKTQGIIALVRRYYEGDQVVYMTTRQKAWLDLHPGKLSFVVNLSATVVDAVVERLQVTSFDVQPDDADLAMLLWQWWTANRMDALQTETHRAAVRDGEAFVLTAWNNESQRPDFVYHPRYVDRQAGGDGFGMWVDYENGDLFGMPMQATKQWSETLADGTKRIRRTIYYPERIEKWQLDGQWQPVTDDEGEPWPLPWVMADGSPIGIPVAHFRNPGVRSELKDIIPLQDALNKAWLDILAASDSTAFRMLVVLGFVPTTDGQAPATDGSNLLQVAPGQILATTKRPGDVSVDAIEPSSLDPLLEVEERIVYRVAQISDTPLSRFQFTRQVAAEGTLRQMDAPMIAKIEERQTLFGNAWEDMMRQALRQATAFGGQALTDVSIGTQWKPAAVRDEKTQVEVAKAKKDLGVPASQIWHELGYDAEQIETMNQSPEVQAKVANQQMAVALAQQNGIGQ